MAAVVREAGAVNLGQPGGPLDTGRNQADNTVYTGCR